MHEYRVPCWFPLTLSVWNRRLLRGHQQSTTQLDKPDDDFRELLDKYKLIKDQLVSLKEIEDRTNSAVQTKSELDRPVVHYVTCPSPWDDKENTNRIDLTLEGTVSENEKNRTAGSKDQQVIVPSLHNILHSAGIVKIISGCQLSLYQVCTFVCARVYISPIFTYWIKWFVCCVYTTTTANFKSIYLLL